MTPSSPPPLDDGGPATAHRPEKRLRHHWREAPNPADLALRRAALITVLLAAVTLLLVLRSHP